MVRRRRRLPSSAAPTPAALDDDDIMSEILLRLPPLPSSLPRASLVCKRWRRLVSDPHFLRRFREHHRKPPILGFFSQRVKFAFTSALNSPDSIPDARFSPPLDNAADCKITDCRHGRVLFLNRQMLYFVVWDPVTGEQRGVDFPGAFCDNKSIMNGAVVCAADEQGHVHGACHSSPFQIVLLGCNSEGFFTLVYHSSEICRRGNAGSLLWPQDANPIELPPDAVVCGPYFRTDCQFLITPADDGGINFLCLSDFIAQVWKWNASCDVGAGWMLGSKVDLNNLLSLESRVVTRHPQILGMAEDDNTMFLSTNVGVFMLHLESMKFKKLSIGLRHCTYHYTCYPFTSFYTAGRIAEGV
ncbi:unnamed protein product [Urochloa decumbens]|uniref:F-box domain-containing protein n=1 Tax=Urochloa decumbens TaxID=240449 RepID=A0ABC9BRE7_9POAL